MRTDANTSANRIHYRKAQVNELEIFYREAGSPSAPVILLLHGFPSSSHMFRNLIGSLAGDFRLIAPDYPGFGHSSNPSPDNFEYSFDHLADIIEKFIDTLNLREISIYMQDYGGPIGFRIISRRPELVSNLIIQNANVFTEGIGPDVQKIGELTEAGDYAGLDAAIAFMMSPDGIREQYLYGSAHQDRISPDSYNMDHLLFEQPGRKEIQKILFQNYATNFPQYPDWQAYLEQYRPRTLVTWGKNDKIFPGAGAVAYKTRVPNAEIHLFDGGHFLLEEYGPEIAGLIHDFLNRKQHRNQH